VRAVLADAMGPAGARDGRILVAWSGGPDSAALLGLLELLGPDMGLELVVGHVDHGLRPESVVEAAMVQKAAAARGVPVVCERLALAPGPGLPARARAARRAALAAMARDNGSPFVALGHTATDQAETMLMHLARGAGLHGIAGMDPVDRKDRGRSPPTWLRPLLGISRARSRALAERLEIPFVDDPTNLDRGHPRVQVRHEVLPVLRRHNPRVELALAAAARRVADARDAIDHFISCELERRRLGRASERVSIRGLPSLPRAVRTGLIRRVLTEGGVDHEALGHETVDAVDRALVAGSEEKVRSWDVSAEKLVRLTSEELWVEGRGATRVRHRSYRR
jgi:tRNA(Ile)-lysidine synthase